MRPGGGYDLYRLAAEQLGAKRHVVSVDFYCNAGISYISMNGVSKIHSSRTLGQFDDVAGRGKHENLIRKQVNLEMFDKFD